MESQNLCHGSLTQLATSFWSIFIICISYIESIDFINPNSSIVCGTSGEVCNLNCTTDTAACKYTTITLYNNVNFNFFCQNQLSWCRLTTYAYNVTNMQVIVDGLPTGFPVNLFVNGNQSDTINIYCRGGNYVCNGLQTHSIAPNLNLNIYCQYSNACNLMLISGKS